MIMLTFQQDGAYHLGIKTDRGILDVQAANRAFNVPGLADTPAAFYAAGLDALPALVEFAGRAGQAESAAAWLLDENRLQIGPAVPAPCKLICIGLNYRNHAREAKMDIPKTPVVFSKFNNAVASPGDAVPLPVNAIQYDYEAELVVVIGKRARYVTQEDALAHVLGYCNGNDVSARDLQFLSSQWLLGKTPDKFMPLGPYLMTADEAGDPQNWPIRCWFNSELRQNSNTGDMIFPVAELISYLSQYMTLEPGDIISTGTPEGVIQGLPKPQAWMKPGDTMTVEVGPLGRLTNDLVSETVRV